jgi:DNA ligase-1
MSRFSLFFILLIGLFPSIFATKPDLFLLKTYKDTQAIVGWTMSEKLDGVRGFWDGKQLLSRGGKKLNPPKWFVKNYPPFAIDGELWTQRGDFENISSIVRRHNSKNRWKNITHQIFEVPNQSGGLLDRLTVLQKYLDKNSNAFIKIIRQTPIDSKQALQNFLNVVVMSGGEGVVVRNPKTLYQTGRLSSALKVKKYLDTECRVVKILQGKGKYRNKMGSVLCQLDNKNTVKIGSGFSDDWRNNPPEIGTQITFKYYGLTKNGKYRFPVFLRIRAHVCE